MKPRQTLKNYHNSNVPPYQQNLPSAIASSSSTSSSTTSALRDIDLAKLGLTLDDMPNLQANSNLNNQEDLVKCLQAIYGKSNTDILQKLPPLNDWPMQSISPPDFQRMVGCSVLSGGGGGGGGSSNGGSSNNCNNINLNVRGATSLGYNNNIASGNNYNTHSNSSHLKQHDLQQQLANSQHQSTSNVNHFRVSNLQPSPQQLSQQKSILSLHQHHQNDLGSRRLNHHLNTTNASFANINTANSAPTTANSSNNTIASSSGTTLDTNNLNSFNSIMSKANSVAGVSNIMDTLGSTDNMFYEGSINTTKDTSNNQQSLIKHQQLQRLLKATGSQLRPSSSTPPTTTTTTTNISSHRSDMMPQRNINSNLTSTQHPISTQAPTISPPHTALSSVPKSLLNLAACSSTSPTSTNTSSLPTHSYFSSMVNQLNLKSGRNINQTNLNSSNNPDSRSTVKNSGCNYSDNLGDVFNQRSSSNVANQNSLLQHSTRANVTETNNNLNNSSINRSSSKQLQLSLLSDDQSPRQPNTRAASIPNLNTTTAGTPKIVPPSSTYKVTAGSSSKEAYLADLQERAARAGVSIGEISKPTVPTNVTNNNTCSNISQQGSINISPNQSKDETYNNNLVGRKEIESALSRVEARNDLSLLYPPMLLAANSQKQINALSAGLQGSEDTELFTKEVKKIILEECNIIYECKECNNLFRSLANLVKHKRTYCLEQNSERMSIDINKRSYAATPMDQLVTTIPLNEEVQLYCDANPEQILSGTSSRIDESTNQNIGLKMADRRSNLRNDLRVMRMVRNQEKKNSQEQVEGQKSSANMSSNAHHASLSRILQSQPKNRLPASRDNALLGTLNLRPNSSNNFQQKNAYNGSKNIDCTSGDVGEQLIRNSSLAKTLLNEKVKNNPRQSLIELSKVFSNESDQPRAVKRSAPKRNLEDCIQKVKRDKLLTEEDEERSLVVSNTSATIIRGSSLQTFQDKTSNQTDQEMRNITIAPKFNSPDTADYDSDKLEIDLDEPGQKNSFKKAKRRISTAASSTASSSTSSSARLNSSSALLKALTRPVDAKRAVNNAPAPCDKESDDQVYTADHDKESKSSLEKSFPESDASSPLFETYACDICDNFYEDLMSLMDHTVENHPKEKMVYPCIFCSLSFIALENVCRHIVDIHKKPKAQVKRLKEVVRSRSYISSDFLACCDYPSSAVDLKDAASEVDDKPIDEAIQELVEAEAAFECIMKSEDIKTRDKDGEGYAEMDESLEENPSSEEDRPIELNKQASPTGDQKLSSRLGDNSESEPIVESEDLECETSLTQPTEATVESESLEKESLSTEQSSSSDDSSSEDSSSEDSSSEDSSSEDSSSQDSSSDELSSSDSSSEEVRRSNLNKQASPTKDQKLSSRLSNNSDSEANAESEGLECESSPIQPTGAAAESECELSPIEITETNAESEGLDCESSQIQPLESFVSSSESSKQIAQKPSSSIKSAVETTSSSSNASGSGGIMKLKIQLKTTPDEKSKVYEIAR